MRQTSIDAYNAIKNSGELGRLQLKVYDYIYQNGPCSAKNVHLALREEGQNDGCYTTRLSELRDLGVLDEVGTRECEFTGRNVTLWDVTSGLPKRMTKRDKLLKQIGSTEQKLISLRAKLTDLEAE